MDSSTVYDLVIIGGGINGAGIALDAALRGYSTVLLEKDDFAAHTTGASTKLIHGGLRYLEYFEFSLVRESLRERAFLLKNAPHLVQPLIFHIPLYKNARRGPLTIKAGLMLYDWIAGKNNLPKHEFYTRPEELKHNDPEIRREGLRSIAAYHDAQAAYPERLCLELALAARQQGATVYNHHTVTGFEIQENRITGVHVLSSGGNPFTLHARMVINATGAYVDALEKKARPDARRKIGATKGVHIVINTFANGPRHAIYTEAAQDGRPFFIIPWEGYYLVGTTDTYYEGNPDKVKPDEADIAYLLTALNHLFPARRFERSDVLYAYAGLRPLPWEPGVSPARVTRRHIIYDHQNTESIVNMLTIIGGKLTTYRSLAENCVDRIGEKLGEKRPCATWAFRLPGAALPSDYAHYAANSPVPDNVLRRLFRLYGSRTEKIMRLVRENTRLAREVCDSPPCITAQVVFAVKEEMARTMEDIMIRRLGMYAAPDLGLSCVNGIADAAAPLLNWSEKQTKEAVERYRAWVETYHCPSVLRKGNV